MREALAVVWFTILTAQPWVAAQDSVTPTRTWDKEPDSYRGLACGSPFLGAGTVITGLARCRCDGDPCAQSFVTNRKKDPDVPAIRTCFGIHSTCRSGSPIC
jgi:hypothetical protein